MQTGQLRGDVDLIPFWMMPRRQQRLKSGKKDVDEIRYVTVPLWELSKISNREQITHGYGVDRFIPWY